jgi:hypothetical protein
MIFVLGLSGIRLTEIVRKSARQSDRLLDKYDSVFSRTNQEVNLGNSWAILSHLRVILVCFSIFEGIFWIVLGIYKQNITHLVCRV